MTDVRILTNDDVYTRTPQRCLLWDDDK